MSVNSIIGSFFVFSTLGLSIEAGAVYTLFTALGEFFYHTNVKTPRWIGYIFHFELSFFPRLQFVIPNCSMKWLQKSLWWERVAFGW